MHGAYDISNDDKLYVLSTFVVMPIRWLDAYGWRRLTEAERVASANYYRALGRHMGITGIPETHAGVRGLPRPVTSVSTSASTRAPWRSPRRRCG